MLLHECYHTLHWAQLIEFKSDTVVSSFASNSKGALTEVTCGYQYLYTDKIEVSIGDHGDH